MKNTLSKVRLIGIGIVLLAGIAVAVFLALSRQDNRQRASTSTGTASIRFLAPGGTSMVTPNSTATITIQATGTGQSQVDGFQVVANITGSIPTNLSLEPAAIPDLTAVSSSITDVSGGKRLMLAFITKDPQKPFNANGASVTLATLRFTAPTSGTLSISPDPSLSKILQSNTSTDLLGPITNSVFSFTTPATATPIVTPSPTPLPVVCWSRVVVPTTGSPYWPNGCKGSPISQACSQVIVTLTADEIAGYNSWVAAGRPAIPGCTNPSPTPSPTATVRPTTTPVVTPSPTPVVITPNPVNWVTSRVSLSADDFYILQTNGKRYTPRGTVTRMTSDPGSPTYTTLEVEWTEQTLPQRMYMYLYSDGTDWWVSEFRSYSDAPNYPQFAYFKPGVTYADRSAKSGFFRTRLGSTFTGNFDSKGATDVYRGDLLDTANAPRIVFTNMRLRGFTQYSGPWATTSPSPTASPTPIVTATATPTVRPTSTSTPSLAPTATPTSLARSFGMKVNFASLSKSYSGPIQARVSWGFPSTNAPQQSKTVTFTRDSTGNYVGMFDRAGAEPLPANIWITIKGEKHVQRLYTALTASADNQVFDLTSKAMLPGDLPTQDGVANLEDLGRVVALLAKRTLTSDDLFAADVNYDGIINAADISAILATLMNRADESGR